MNGRALNTFDSRSNVWSIVTHLIGKWDWFDKVFTAVTLSYTWTFWFASLMSLRSVHFSVPFYLSFAFGSLFSPLILALLFPYLTLNESKLQWNRWWCKNNCEEEAEPTTDTLSWKALVSKYLSCCKNALTNNRNSYISSLKRCWKKCIRCSMFNTRTEKHLLILLCACLKLCTCLLPVVSFIMVLMIVHYLRDALQMVAEKVHLLWRETATAACIISCLRTGLVISKLKRLRPKSCKYVHLKCVKIFRFVSITEALEKYLGRLSCAMAEYLGIQGWRHRQGHDVSELLPYPYFFFIGQVYYARNASDE